MHRHHNMDAPFRIPHADHHGHTEHTAPHHPGHKEPHPRTIFIRKDTLLADIDAQLQLLAESRPTDKGTPHPVLNTAATRFRSQIDRWCDHYLDLAKSRMAAYLRDRHKRSVTNIRRDWEEQEIHLLFPWYWKQETFPQLSDAVHRYIVEGVLSDLLSLVLTSKDPVTVDKVTAREDAYADIKHCCVTSLPGTQKKKLHPF